MMMTMNVLFAQENYLLVGTYTGKKSEGIYVYKFNTTTGAMEKVSSVFTENPSYLALHPHQKFLYAVNEVQSFDGQETGGVTALSVDPVSVPRSAATANWFVGSGTIECIKGAVCRSGWTLEPECWTTSVAGPSCPSAWRGSMAAFPPE